MSLPGKDSYQPSTAEPVREKSVVAGFRQPGLLFPLPSRLICAAAALVFSLALTSFTIIYSIEDVASAMRSGNAADISRFFDSRIDLSFPDKSNNYSKTQAEMILKDFFASNQVKGFLIKHKGENKDGSQFCIGVLQTKTRDFRTRFYLKKKGEQQFLQEIVFEAD